MPNKGYKITEEAKRKMSIAKVKAYAEGRLIGNTGKHHSDETKEKMRLKKLGHIPWNKDKKMTNEYCETMRKAQIGTKHYNMRDEKHHLWKGDEASLSAIHVWVRRRKTKPDFCEECKLVPPRDLANISQEYKRDINDFEWLCRKCHMIKDNRINKIPRQYKKYD